jgi:staphylococcal nuclease domain-containing protein 1
LKIAEEKGKKERKGANGKENVKTPYFNDLSGGKGKKIDAGKAKNMFPFLKDEKHLTGVVDLVLNGSRFKVRFNQNSVMAVLVLDGVRALPNEGEFKKISE